MKQDKVDAFLFSPTNPKTVTYFRILMAFMLAFMFAPRGLTPIYPLSNFPNFSDYIFSTEYYILIYALIASFTIGLKPRLTALLLFIVLFPHDFLSEGHKSKQVILCALLCFGFVKSLPIWQINNNNNSMNAIGPIWPIRLIQLQLSILYGVNAIAKTTYHYLSGDALIKMSVAYDNFNANLSDGYFHFKDLQIPVFVLAIISVLIEYFLAIGLWFKKTRWIAVFIGITFHFSLTIFLTVYMLDYVSLLLYLAFIIPFDLNRQQPFNLWSTFKNVG